MITKDQILTNLREYSASQIVHAIKCGKVSMYELSKSGKLTPLMKKRIEEQLALESSNAHTPMTDIKPSLEPIQETSPVPKEMIEGHHDSAGGISYASQQTYNHQVNINGVSQNTHGPSIDNSIDEIYGDPSMFKNIFSFKGRIRRTEYGATVLICFLWYIIFFALTQSADENPQYQVLAVIVIITAAPVYWVRWAQGAKRCHDMGNSGWYQLIPFYFLAMLFGDSQKGANKYGDNPKEKQ